jgi:hypothetical protein
LPDISMYKVSATWNTAEVRMGRWPFPCYRHAGEGPREGVHLMAMFGDNLEHSDSSNTLSAQQADNEDDHQI